MTSSSRARSFLSVLGLVCMFAVAGCATGTPLPAGQPGGGGGAGGDVDADSYIIGPGDTLNVFVWRNPEISTTVPVRPDGKISTPLVEDMVAVGKTPTQLARDIEEVLAEYIRSPNVNIIVQGFVGTFSEQIRVVGQAAQPMSLAYRDEMTLLDVMIEVGGLTPFAAGNRSKVVRRDSDGKSQEYRVRLDDLLNDGDMSQNIAMRPGDVVVIPESFF
ncbi:MAG: XrtA/PEP-CTERM system exopolysaccharide export protein [Pseudomonadota bacterium]